MDHYLDSGTWGDITARNVADARIKKDANNGTLSLNAAGSIGKVAEMTNLPQFLETTSLGKCV